MHLAAITVFRVRLLLLAMGLALMGIAGGDGKERLAEANPAQTSKAAAAVPGFKAKPAMSDAYSTVTDQAPNDRQRAKGRPGSST